MTGLPQFVLAELKAYERKGILSKWLTLYTNTFLFCFYSFPLHPSGFLTFLNS